MVCYYLLYFCPSFHVIIFGSGIIDAVCLSIHLGMKITVQKGHYAKKDYGGHSS
jgi:hypothetical protein